MAKQMVYQRLEEIATKFKDFIVDEAENDSEILERFEQFCLGDLSMNAEEMEQLAMPFNFTWYENEIDCD